MRVVAQQLGIHHHTGQTVAIHRQAGPLFLSKAKAQGHRLIGATTLQFLVEIFQVTLGYRHQGLQFGEGGIQIRHPLAHDRQNETGAIIRQQHAVAVVNQPALGRQRLQLHPVAIGLGAIGFILGNLQGVIARQNHPSRAITSGQR